MAEKATGASGRGRQVRKALCRRRSCRLPQQAARQVLSAQVSLTSVFGMGSEATAAGGGVKGAERVAGVGGQRSRAVGKAPTGVPQQEAK